MQALTSNEFRDIVEGRSTGIPWSATTETLNINLAVWDAGHAVAAHVNDHVDVTLIVLSGEGRLTIDETSIGLEPGTIASVPRGATRSVLARSRLAYVTVHRARGGLMPEPPLPRAGTV